MAILSKICGLSTPQAVTAAVDGGASHLGFMFFPKSPRNIELGLAAQLAEPARARNVKICAVTVDPDDDLLDQLCQVLKPDLIQLHGDETPSRARRIADRYGVGIIKVISVGQADDIPAARAFDAVAEHLLFDTKPPKNTDRPGGTGLSFDWTLMAGQLFPRPWFLAGGLDPWNVAEAIGQSRAPMVDVSSGVERGPGLKDPALITAFLEAVRRV